MSYKNLIEITKYLEEFEAVNSAKPFDVERFAYWLSEKVAQKPRSLSEVTVDISESIKQQSHDVQISIMIGRMGKYARVYTKKILAKTKLSGLDDYGFIATLMFRESMTKSELTHHNLMESVTSGADIIKRLVKHGYVEEFDDEDDKRSRRVRITQVGKLLMFKIFEEMDTVSSIITGNLTGDEKLFLLHYLNKLDNLHTDIYNNDRKAELEAIKMKYIIG
jgi:DNA-binding MarR family transcriptional regulator